MHWLLSSRNKKSERWPLQILSNCPLYALTKRLLLTLQNSIKKLIICQLLLNWFIFSLVSYCSELHTVKRARADRRERRKESKKPKMLLKVLVCGALFQAGQLLLKLGRGTVELGCDNRLTGSKLRATEMAEMTIWRG